MRTMGYDFNIDVRDLSLKEYTVFEYLKKYNTVFLDSGRSCIKILCQLIKNKEILVPSFSCFSVIYGFTEGLKPVFYEIYDKNFGINFDDLKSKITDKTGAIYITNYFGHMLSDEDAEKINKIKKEYNLIVIEDNTQSMFSGGLKVGDYSLCSTRKWFSVPDGGVIYSDNSLSTLDLRGLKKDSKQCDKLYPQIVKTMFLKNMIDYPPKEIADLFAVVEEELNEYADNGEIFLMNDFTEFVYKCNSVNDMIKKRQENEKYLRTLINSPYLTQAIDERAEGECPFNMPMYCMHRDEMWNYLTERFNIYPSVLWRTYQYDPVNKIGNTAKMGHEIISFPIDQRYGKEDMEFLAEAINSFKI